MRRISKLALAVGIAAALVATGPAMAGPSAGDGSFVVKLLDRLLGAVFGGGQDAGPSSFPDGLSAASESGSGGQDSGPSNDPNGLTAPSESGSPGQDSGPSNDPDG